MIYLGIYVGIYKKSLLLLCISLCALCILCGSLCNNKLRTYTEDTEVSQSSTEDYFYIPNKKLKDIFANL